MAKLSIINLKDKDGADCPTRAKVFGKLAVHDAIEEDKTVSLSHVPTGLRIAKKLTEAQAIAITLLISNRFNWDFNSKAEAQAIKEPVLEIVRGVVDGRPVAP